STWNACAYASVGQRSRAAAASRMAGDLLLQGPTAVETDARSVTPPCAHFDEDRLAVVLRRLEAPILDCVERDERCIPVARFDDRGHAHAARLVDDEIDLGHAAYARRRRVADLRRQ